MPANLNPGFITLHGNQLEQLRSAVFDWLRKNPLDPLEQEIFLVQSNGVAEWLKIALAEEMGICAATQVTLPARFLWQAYRGMLGPDTVSSRSAFDRSSLTWRLMRLLPTLLEQPGFEPLRHFLAGGEAERRLQLAQRMSDLMDQYQVYRADWLADWAQGRDVLRAANGDAISLAADQRWQALLWRAIVGSVPQAERGAGRADIHLQFVDALHSGAEPSGALPRRVILFGISALPYQTLHALSALSTRMQVIAAVPNPCQFYWGDIISGRELLTAQRRRQPLRSGRDLAGMPLEELHAHSHPLLAGWGRLGRDFIRMLDEFDDGQASAEGLSSLRVDLFSTGEGETLLEQVQSAIRDLQPLEEHRRARLPETDRSVEFHIAHSVQREVEVLHDRLLALLAEPAEATLRPRDIVVMVPDIETFSPAIRAVFGQYGERDKRHIPFEIADVNERKANLLLVALDWLLRLPDQRCLQSEVRDLLDVPAIAERFGIDEADLPRLAQWIEGAGVRWGLDGNHRKGLGLAYTGEQNAWIFGIRRMLLGYASGDGGAFAGIEPYAEVGGLDADLAGALASLVDTLLHWRTVLDRKATPAEWSEHARALLKDFFSAKDEHDRLTLAKLEQSLQAWHEDCDNAEFVEPVPAAVLREAWLGAIDEQSLNQRFVSGGVTFCTLMPMRAVPYRMVCLLGMNDGDFPRRAQRADFDLLALPQLARPGDRSRRDDDRYLMLEALLAARDKLYISWVGRNVRDNTELPPSVLVSQLRDYLAAGWDLALGRITTEHPLQPFSRRYFEQGGLLTYAREWRDAHVDVTAAQASALPALQLEPDSRLRLAELARFIQQPVKVFFRQRLQVAFDEVMLVGQDDEPFALNDLEEYQLASILLDDSGEQEAVAQAEARLRQHAARLGRQGLLPVGLFGAEAQDYLVHELVSARQAWLQLCQRFVMPSDKLRVSIPHKEVRLEDWIDKMRSDGSATVWLAQNPGRLVTQTKDGVLPRTHKLIEGWIRQLAAAAEGHVVTGYLVGRDAIVVMDPVEPAQAQLVLSALISCWREGLERPLPTACKTALALLAGEDPRAAYNGGYDSRPPGEVNHEMCLARLWPDFDHLSAEPEWEAWSRRLYGPLVEWAGKDVRVLSFEAVLEQKEAA